VKLPKNWWWYALAIGAGLATGYYVAKGTYLVYKADGTPIGPSVGTDPTVNFVS
jgi:hypothetical protein